VISISATALEFTTRLNSCAPLVHLVFRAGEGGAQVFTLTIDAEDAIIVHEQLGAVVAELEARDQAAEADPETTTDPNLQRRTD